MYIQQISVNPTHMGLDRCQIIKYSRLSWRYLYYAMFLFVTAPIVGLYTTNQRSTPFGYLLHLLVKVHRRPLQCFWSHHSWRSWWSGQTRGHKIPWQFRYICACFANNLFFYSVYVKVAAHGLCVWCVGPIWILCETNCEYSIKATIYKQKHSFR